MDQPETARESEFRRAGGADGMENHARLDRSADVDGSDATSRSGRSIFALLLRWPAHLLPGSKGKQLRRTIDRWEQDRRFPAMIERGVIIQRIAAELER